VLTGINVEGLLRQLVENPQLWNYDDSWTRKKPTSSPIRVVDAVVLRFNEAPVWNRLAFSILTTAKDIVFDVMRAVPCEHLGKVIITRLMPGGIISDHIDTMPPGVVPYWQRYQVPLISGPDVIFRCGDDRISMQPGCAYWFNNQITHSVNNYGNTERLSMLIDARPFSE